jgi:hypothetical protein
MAYERRQKEGTSFVAEQGWVLWSPDVTCAADPYETSNLLGDPAAASVLAMLKKELGHLRASSRP